MQSADVMFVSSALSILFHFALLQEHEKQSLKDMVGTQGLRHCNFGCVIVSIKL